MPRSPLITSAVRDLAQYFGATTDAAFIDRTWSISKVAETNRAAASSSNVEEQLRARGAIVKQAADPTVGTPTADHIANLLNGTVSVGSFLRIPGMSTNLGGYDQQLQIYRMEGSSTTDKELEKLSSEPSNDVKGESQPGESQHPHVNLYAAVVLNPFMGPMTKDMGAVEIFMNSIPTLEFSRCVPYLNVEVISLLRTRGTVAPPLTLTGFLNPPALSPVDAAILRSQGVIVNTEATTLGSGLRSGMELFTAPQTLTNMGQHGSEFVPVIDRFRPLASLGNLTLSTKIQGGTLLFTTGRLEIMIHDRSRLREMAAFVRPDLYGTTFLDITYGWSHPEGGMTSRNVYGKFLDAMKSTTRFRIAGSSFSFEEGGQVKVTLNVQTVGSTDLLYLGPKAVSSEMKEMIKIIRLINEELVKMRSRNTTPSMADYDYLAAFQDPASVLAASSDKNVLEKTRKLIQKSSTPSALAGYLKDLLGKNLKQDSSSAAEGSAVDKAQNALQDDYDAIISSVPTYHSSGDAFGVITDENFRKMFDDTFYAATPSGETTKLAGGAGSKVMNAAEATKGGKTMNDFYSFGSIFMNFIAKPIKESGQYDEVQVVFYPFNRYAGLVHDLPISCFPIEKERFKKSIVELARRTPNVSCRQIIGLLYDRFTHFPPAQAYLMAGFYNQSKAESGTVEEIDSKAKFTITYPDSANPNKKITKTVAASFQLTFEERLGNVGIPEKKFVLPSVQVAVEGCPLTDADGKTLPDASGNPKSLIKIHVYDSSTEPHATIADIARAAKDNEVGIVTNPVASTNAIIRSSGDPQQVGVETLQAAQKAIEAGEKVGLLEAIDLSTLEASDIGARDVIESMKNGNTFYRVKGDYSSIKRLVSAGVPTVTYGSSTSAITNVTLASNTSPGLGNVQLLRAFAEPGEAQTESLTSGVPMGIIPANLSVSTIGCPLFAPLQRIFMDFGTGTSIDNLYHVISVESTIGKDGFKTDLAFKFADSFASYRSLNQNLALLAVSLAGGITNDITIDPTYQLAQSTGQSTLPFAPTGGRSSAKLIEDARRFARQTLVKLLVPIAAIEIRTKAEAERQISQLANKVASKAQAEKEKLEKKAEAMIPEEARIKMAKAQQDINAAIASAQSKAEPAARAAILANQYAQMLEFISTLPSEVGAAILDETLTAYEEARKQAAENASSGS